NRPGLDRRDRSLLNLGILTALRAHDELAGHVRGALNNGLTRAQITESIIHTAGYCGAPAALAAMRIAQQEFDQL
ncbi:carboxymuconolactone decarboxylase family protein, partial [Nocardia sp. NPDC060220]